MGTLSKGLDIPLFCKIRILPTWEQTKELVEVIEEEGKKIFQINESNQI